MQQKHKKINPTQLDRKSATFNILSSSFKPYSSRHVSG